MEQRPLKFFSHSAGQEMNPSSVTKINLWKAVWQVSILVSLSSDIQTTNLNIIHYRISWKMKIMSHEAPTLFIQSKILTTLPKTSPCKLHIEWNTSAIQCLWWIELDPGSWYVATTNTSHILQIVFFIKRPLSSSNLWTRQFLI